MIVLIADAAQNAMAGDYTSWSDGMLLVATIVGWAYALDWLAYRYPKTLGRFVHPEPRVARRVSGSKLQQNLDRELISDEELMTQLRLQGVDGPGRRRARRRGGQRRGQRDQRKDKDDDQPAARGRRAPVAV